MVQVFGMLVSLGPLVLGGCPHASIGGKDVHADKEAMKIFVPKWLSHPVWDDFGINLLQQLIDCQLVS